MQYIKKKRVDRRSSRPFPGKYDIIDLSRMLTYPRSAGSELEEKYIHKFIDVVPGMKKDPMGNRFITIGKKPTTLFSSHTDTVHDRYQRYGWVYDKETNTFKQTMFHPTERPQKVIMKGKWVTGTGRDVLGADDTTGNWLMLNLISEKKPGLYIFHRQEEQGRLGSEWIAKHRPRMLKGMQRAIAFDRKGYEDIITHQVGYRTASDKFAKELSQRLGGGFKPDPTGTFTDTLSYAHIIPECTNISIGYKHAHMQDERQNLRFARHLYTRLREVDFETLPVVRKPEPRKVRLSWIDWEYGNYGLGAGTVYQQKTYLPSTKTYLTPQETEYQERIDMIKNRVEEHESNIRGLKQLFGETDDDLGPKSKKKKEGVKE